jgi:hypothetical protein
MRRPVRIALRSLGATLILIGLLGALLGIFGVWPASPRVERLPVPPKPPSSSIPLSPTNPPGLGEGEITMRLVLRDGGEIFWLLVAGVGLVLIVVFDRRRGRDRYPVP